MKSIIQLALLLGALLSAATHALGATPPGVVKLDNGTLAMFTIPEGTTIPYVDNSPEPLIYGNLATNYPKGLYWCCVGMDLSGPLEGEIWDAAAFTPTANATVTKVTVGVGYMFSSTTFDVLLSVNADNKGVPGKALKTWKIKFPNGQPMFGSCCVVKSGTGSVPISANTQYWVVLSTESNSDIVAAWNIGDYDEIDKIPTAQYVNGVWTVYSNPAPAFAVYGH
jgi:hypothetical protein